MTEDERKIQQWRHERCNKKGIRSQAEYDETTSKKNDIQLGVLQGNYPTVGAVAITIECQLGFGKQQSRVLANKYWMQKQCVEAGNYDCGIPKSILERITC